MKCDDVEFIILPDCTDDGESYKASSIVSLS